MNNSVELAIPPVVDVSESAVIDAYEKNQFNAKRSSLYLILAILLGVYILVATLALVVKASGPMGLLTFLESRSGAVELVTPYRNPPVTDKQAINWAREKVCDLLSLHFKKYIEQVGSRKNYFVGDGWSLYQGSLLKNKTIETIKENGLIITSINQDTPRLLQKYMLDGRTNWRIEMPILQTIQGASDAPSTVRTIVSVTVEETRRDESIEGLKIRIFGVME